MRAFLFPGQGSLQAGMGRPWVTTPSWGVVDRLATALGDDLAALLVDADDDALRTTANAQRATFALSLVVLDATTAVGITADAYAGHSLGEYTALVAAGALDEAAAAELVAERAAAMQWAADRHPGTMAAILGLPTEDVAKACTDAGEVWIANDNAPGQVVIAGTRRGVTEGGEAAKARGASRVMPLNVGGAFHSPLMADAQTRLDAALAATAFEQDHAPVAANVDAEIHTRTDWRALLSAQLCQPVQWRQSLAALATAGVTEFVELGPGAALSGMVKRTVADAARSNVATPDDLSQFGGT